MATVRAGIARVLRVVRQVVGAPDYERYLEHHSRCHAETAPLDRRAFYAEFVSRRFGPGPTRCC
ncbi:MAG: YbdD/YjiX family protein [Gemmatimonadales bacterium]